MTQRFMLAGCLVLAAIPCLACLPAVGLTADATDDGEQGFQPLFNGRDLAGWDFFDNRGVANWVVEDGLLVCTGTGRGWLGTQRDYADFELRLEYRMPEGGNSGVYLRAPTTGQISRQGMEIQLLDDDHPKYARLDWYQYTGALYHALAPGVRATKPAGQWNAMTIRLHGRDLTVFLNGKRLYDANLDVLLRNPEVAQEHPGLKRTTGRIGLQNHGAKVAFRNIRVQELK